MRASGRQDNPILGKQSERWNEAIPMSCSSDHVTSHVTSTFLTTNTFINSINKNIIVTKTNQVILNKKNRINY